MTRGALKCGDIVLADFDPSSGHEYKKVRPALVVESDAQLKKTSVVTLVPISSQSSSFLKGDDLLIPKSAANALFIDSVIKMHYIESFDYSRLHKKIGVADPTIMVAVKLYIKKHFGI